MGFQGMKTAAGPGAGLDLGELVIVVANDATATYTRGDCCMLDFADTTLSVDMKGAPGTSVWNTITVADTDTVAKVFSQGAFWGICEDAFPTTGTVGRFRLAGKHEAVNWSSGLTQGAFVVPPNAGGKIVLAADIGGTTAEQKKIIGIMLSATGTSRPMFINGVYGFGYNGGIGAT